VRGTGGAFEVSLDGELLYSKLKTKRFPQYGEIPGLLGLN
jgi:selT/selW/selH-like putative selenoprotein